MVDFPPLQDFSTSFHQVSPNTDDTCKWIGNFFDHKGETVINNYPMGSRKLIRFYPE